MKMTKYILLAISFVIMLVDLNCNSNPVEPLQPGRRDYVWTVDTIDTPYDAIGRMWASSPKDIWTTSDGSWDQSISHFNGEKWSSFGISGIVVPWAIYGFSDSDVYILTCPPKNI